MLYAKLGEYPTAVMMLSTGTLRSARINFPSCCQIDFVAIKTRQQLRSSSTILERPCENFFTQLYTALHDKHLSPPTGNISL
ncbi:hypothetical protein TNIN_159141 [Trichonephila inaurata madagascariensis]|uniref:Uncharacterized protein n=1 Tax=Trichonephila inaurata madagascariensis TaxID=2747483 RepID=A0A8X7CSF5_9ARAC|nr:hypothetical protein TNIN_159141 [Trichonephila inaurata madagascariensis]